MKEGHITEAQPNAAHHAVAELYRLGKLDCVVTQNVDYLHQKAGVPDGIVFELHGNNRWIRCMNCGSRYEYEAIKVRLWAGEEIPNCERCSGLLKPEVVFFGEALPVDILEQAQQHAATCDLCIVIGSTLVVYPAAAIPEIALRVGAQLAIINLSETPLDNRAHIVIRGSAGDLMSDILEKYQSGRTS
jgi:NAD-dependent deacetylase